MAASTQWYEEKQPEQLAKALSSKFEAIKSKSRLRIALDRFYLSLYYDDSYAGYGQGAEWIDSLIAGLRDRLNENVVQRIVSTFSAKLARSRPKPSVLTDDADWGLLQRAKYRDRAVVAAFREGRAYEEQRTSDLHMLLCGTGGIYCGHRDGAPYLDIVPPWETFVDPAEARYGKPRTLYRQHFMDRRLCASRYPKHKNAILDAKGASGEDIMYAGGESEDDMVELITAWRLPSRPGADDGCVAVVLDGTPLAVGKWKRKHFPVAWSRFLLPPRGFWGIGAVASLVGLQLELNRTLSTRQEAMSLIKPYVLLEHGSKVVESDFSDQIGNFIWYTGTKPDIVTPSAVHPETFQHSDRVKSSMFSQVGLSEMAAASMKPAGLNSGRAIRAYSDMMDDNIHDVMLRREQQILDLSELVLDAFEDIEESDEEKRELVYVGPYGTDKIDFSKCAKDRDAFVMAVVPSSSLSTSLPGKLEDLEDLRNLGIVNDPQELEALLDIPDLRGSSSRRNSMRNLILQVLEEKILGEGISVVPEPGWDAELCKRLCIQTRLYAQLRGAPADRIDLLRIFEEKAIWYIEQANLAEMPPEPPPQPLTNEQPPPEAMPDDQGLDGMASPELGGLPSAM